MPRMNWLGTSEPSSESSVSEQRTQWFGSPKSGAFMPQVTRANSQCDAASVPSAQGELRPASHDKGASPNHYHCRRTEWMM